jgi:hypothetical protein
VWAGESVSDDELEVVFTGAPDVWFYSGGPV